MIKILIADDHAGFRHGLHNLLETYPDLEIVGECSDGFEAVSMAKTLKPDLALIDIGMPGMTGLEALKKIKADREEIKVLILTQYDLEEYLFTVLQDGASGYVLKETASDELIPAIRTVNEEGKAYLSPTMLQSLINEFIERDRRPAMPEGLTPREEEVLKFLAEGKSAKQVAEILDLSLNTVQSHRYHLMDKLDLHNRASLVKFAIRTGIISA